MDDDGVCTGAGKCLEDRLRGFHLQVKVDRQRNIAAEGTVSVVSLESGKVVAEIPVGLHASSLAATPDGKHVAVANANSDTISIIDTETDQVVRNLDVRLFEGAPLGSAPNALALSPGGETLYVANAANNAVAVVIPDHPSMPLRGFIPTGWFPTAVAVADLNADGLADVVVAAGQGTQAIVLLGGADGLVAQL